jgi:putative two-component system response regulator
MSELIMDMERFCGSDFALLARMKILVADDEPANVALLEELLSEGGFLCTKSVTDSKLVLEACQEFEPDIILLDLMMPAPNGFKILESLRGERGAMLLPVIILTADATEETKIRALRAGASDFLLKPFDHLEVLLRVANLLETRHLHLQLEMERAALADAVYARTSELTSAQSELQKAQL